MELIHQREDMSYLAGLVDGEGCFYLANSRNGHGIYHRQPRIIVSNTNKDVMDWLKDNFGGYVTTTYKKNPKHKTMYQWIVVGQRALMLANWLKPLLIIKPNEVDKLFVGLPPESVSLEQKTI